MNEVEVAQSAPNVAQEVEASTKSRDFAPTRAAEMFSNAAPDNTIRCLLVGCGSCLFGTSMSMGVGIYGDKNENDRDD